MTDTGRPEPPFVQNVFAVNGFAYGVIGADIHVFGDGLPLYILANWQAEPETSREWLREQPSRMLDARFAVVDFTGRDQDLAGLRYWVGNGPRLAVRWLHGPAGQGKTRLAAKFAAETAAAGWKVVTATQGPGAVFPPQGSQDLSLGDTTGLLMIVDYADRWPLTHLTWLFSNAMLHQVGLPTRVLLIARSADGWPAVQAALANHQAGMTTHFLEALTDERGRAGMFTAARDSFATRYDLDAATAVGPPGPLDDPDMGLTLAVHMAALVAVDAHVHGQRPPQGMPGLTIYLLNREHLHWAILYGDNAHELNPADRTYQTPPAAMNRVVFTAALTGAVTRSAGKAIIEGLKVGPDPDQVLTDHSICYPAAESTGLTVLEPLYPDRLAEDFLALTLPGHPADYPAQRWAPGTATALITRGDTGTPPAHVTRALIFLAAAAAPDRWRHVAAHLNTVLANDPALAIDAGSAALTALTGAVDISVLEAIEPLLPHGRHLDLDVGAAAVSTTLTGHRLAHTKDPGRRAALLNTHAWRLANAGLLPEALAATQEAVNIRRELAEADPAAHLPDLARSLNNLGVQLSGVGRYEQALATAEEVVSIRRRLAEADPGAHLADLAMSLNNLANRQSKLAQREQALATAEEAMNVRRRLAEANPAAFLPDLATSLNNLGNRLSALGRQEETLAPAQEAVNIRRRLAEANPAAHLPVLATSLTNLGVHRSRAGRPEEALTPTQEAVTLYRPLAEANPAHLADLAMSLNNLGNRLSELGRREEALAAAQEAADLYRRLAEASPAAHLPNLATSLHNLGNRLSELGRREEALSPTEEAVSIRRRLAEATPPPASQSLRG